MELLAPEIAREAALERRGIAASRATNSQAKQVFLRLLLLAGDTAALLAAFAVAYLLRFQNPWLPYYSTHSLTFYSLLVFWAIPLWLVIFVLYGLYNLDLLFGGVDEYTRVIHACSIGIIVLILYSFVDRDPGGSELSRMWLIFVWGLSVVLVNGERFAARRFVYWLRKRGHLRRRAIIVGANPEGQAIAEQLHSALTAGLEVVGFADDQETQLPATLNAPVLGRTDQLVELVTRMEVNEIIIASTAVTREQLLETYHTFGLVDNIEIRVSPGLYEILTTGARVKESGYMPLVSLNRLRITGADAWLKRGMDLGLIVLFAPLLVLLFGLIAVLVRLDSPGPVLHRRRVLGVGGRSFDALKFRTMIVNADARLAEMLTNDPAMRAEYERDHKLKHDPRVTRVGRMLRRTSLDELPQLINVALGQMSLVGPRMIAPDEIQLYGKWWMNLLTVKPGLTGPWQVMGRNDLPYEERVRFSMKYIRNHTIWLDVQILFQTIGVVLKGRGAY